MSALHSPPWDQSLFFPRQETLYTDECVTFHPVVEMNSDLLMYLYCKKLLNTVSAAVGSNMVHKTR